MASLALAAAVAADVGDGDGVGRAAVDVRARFLSSKSARTSFVVATSVNIAIK